MFPGSFWPQGFWPADYWPKTGARSTHGQSVGGKVGGRHRVIQAMMRAEAERSLMEEIARDNLRLLALRVEAGMLLHRKQQEHQKQVTDTAVWAALLSEI